MFVYIRSEDTTSPNLSTTGCIDLIIFRRNTHTQKKKLSYKETQFVERKAREVNQIYVATIQHPQAIWLWHVRSTIINIVFAIVV